jgi:WD40 repeat protein
MMDHPNIARVLDAGTTETGRPFFVMELVRGVPITKYCDEQHSTPKERLELFIPICQAVQHAHQKGIIHRDLKPGNVLVALYDGQLVPKVIDFGVAKATSQQLTEKTVFTQFGQIVGTLEYMSPEQAQVNQLDIDTRSDIYSLGVLLYELLTGVTPFDRARLRSAAFDEMMRIVREEEPPRPSMRLSTIDTLPSVAANRRIDPQKLRILVRGELDWIVMKAPEKDRARRYETANGFAADISRFLDNEPVQACPPSNVYRLRKFVHRHRGPVIAASAFLCILCLGLVGTSLGVIWARTAEKNAVAAREHAEALAKTNEQLAVKQTRLADEQTRLADRNIQLAEKERDARQDAEQKSRDLEQQFHVSTAMRLAAQSQAVRRRFPSRSLLLAVEALEATTRHGEPPLPTAEQALRDTLAAVSGAVLTAGSKVVQLAVSPDSRWLASASTDRTIRLWDLNSPRQTASILLEGPTDTVHAIRIDPAARWLAACCQDKKVYLWDLRSEQPSAPILLTDHVLPIHCIAFSPDGQYLATGEQGLQPRRYRENLTCAVRLWRLTLGTEPESVVLGTHARLVHSVEFTPNGRWLISTSDDETAFVWDLLTDDVPGSKRVLRGHTDPITAFAVSPDNQYVATASAYDHRGGRKDNTARVWDLLADDPSTSHRVLQHSPDDFGLFAIVFSRDGRYLVTGGVDGTTRIWDLDATDPQSTVVDLGGHEAPVTSLTISPNGDWLATACEDQNSYNNLPDTTIRLWDLSGIGSGKVTSRILRGHSRGVQSIAFTPDNNWLVSGSADGSARMWDLRLAELVERARRVAGRTLTDEERELYLVPR